MFEDPPQHGMHRGLMSRVFTPRAMAELEDQVREYCIGILDPLVGLRRLRRHHRARVGDAHARHRHAARHPRDDQIAVREKTDSDLRTRRGEPMQVRQEKVANGDMFAEYIDWRAKHPSDDLMTRLLNAEFEDEHGERRTLTRDEVLTYTAVIAGAGNETTGRLIGWLAKLLAEHPDQRRDVVKDRSLIPKVIEESLRFEPTGHATARVVTHDVEYHGTTVPAGSAMLLLIGSANRDPAATTSPTCSTSTVRTLRTSRSGGESTTASAPRSPASKDVSPSTSS